MAIIFLSWLEIGLRPVFLVGRIGILLAFETYRHLLRILDAMLAGNASALEVTCIYLYARFICKHLKEDACDGRVE